MDCLKWVQGRNGPVPTVRNSSSSSSSSSSSNSSVTVSVTLVTLVTLVTNCNIGLKIFSSYAGPTVLPEL